MATIQYSFLNAQGSTVTGGVILDATLSEGHTYAAEVTSYPVEVGTNISDHIRALPLQLSIEGVVVDNPLKSFGLSEQASSQRSENAIEALRLLQTNGTLCTITTSRASYENMALESMSFTRTKDTKGGHIVSLTFKQISTATLQTVEVRRTEARAKNKKQTGAQTASKTTSEQSSSILKAATNGATDFVASLFD